MLKMPVNARVKSKKARNDAGFRGVSANQCLALSDIKSFPLTHQLLKNTLQNNDLRTHMRAIP